MGKRQLVMSHVHRSSSPSLASHHFPALDASKLASPVKRRQSARFCTFHIVPLDFAGFTRLPNYARLLTEQSRRLTHFLHLPSQVFQKLLHCLVSGTASQYNPPCCIGSFHMSSKRRRHCLLSVLVFQNMASSKVRV